jgi:hypothetical protein
LKLALIRGTSVVVFAVLRAQIRAAFGKVLRSVRDSKFGTEFDRLAQGAGIRVVKTAALGTNSDVSAHATSTRSCPVPIPRRPPSNVTSNGIVAGVSVCVRTTAVSNPALFAPSKCQTRYSP